MSKEMQDTMMFKPINDNSSITQTIKEVQEALAEKGYDPIEQLTGYLLSGDPTYITSHKDARSKLRQYERYELLEELVCSYLKKDIE